MKYGSRSTNNMESYGIISDNRLTQLKEQFFIPSFPNPFKSLSSLPSFYKQFSLTSPVYFISKPHNSLQFTTTESYSFPKSFILYWPLL